MLNLSNAPFPVAYRELLLPESIRALSIPPAVRGGHPVTITAGSKRTTANGVHFVYASANSKINCTVIHDASAKFWISFRFKLDASFAPGAADYFSLIGKNADANNYFLITIETNGKFRLRNKVAGFDKMCETAAQTWIAGTWYHVIASLSSVAGMRLIVQNAAAVTNVDTNGLPNGGALLIGDGPGVATNQSGNFVISDVFTGTDDLTLAEETELFNGNPPADVVNEWLLDEGRGVTAYDKGPGANNGTLSAACTWSYGQVKQPVLSLNGYSGYGLSSAGVNIAGALTMVWVGKMKSTYQTNPIDRWLMEPFIDNNNLYTLYWNLITHDLEIQKITGGGTDLASVAYHPTIDDYAIILATNDAAGNLKLFLNGYLADTGLLANAMPGAPATVYLGAEDSLANYDISKPLYAGIIDGAMTNTQALIYSRWLRDIFNLPINL